MSGTRPSVDLPTAALTRGRRLRTRRRATLAAGVVATSLAMGVSAPWLLSGDDGPVRGDDVVATQPPGPDPVAAAPSGWWDMPSRTMVNRLTEVLPSGVVLVSTGDLEADSPQGGVGRGFINSTLGTSMDGAVVTGNVNLMMWPARTTPATLEGVGPEEATFQVGGQADRLTCPGDLGPGTTSCTEIRGPGGQPAGRRSTTAMGDLRILEVVVVSGDGIVYGATANTDDDKWGAESQVTAPRPPLTMAQLEAIVRDQVWTSYQP